MSRRARLALAWAALALAGCASAPGWRTDLGPTLAAARADGRELVVFFALDGRDASDAMRAQLDDARVGAALAAGGFAAAIADGTAQARLYGQWIGGGEGMGIAVLDGAGQVYAARPGPQDPPELAAFVRLCAASRGSLAAARAALARSPADPTAKFALGCLLLQLGCRTQCEPLLLDAALAGVADARHRLARLYALDGNVAAARKWLVGAPRTAPAQVTAGYVAFKERKHAEAVTALEAALRAPDVGEDRQRALLYLGKALHEENQDQRAVPMLEALAREGTGSTFEAAAVHTLRHIRDPQHGHTH